MISCKNGSWSCGAIVFMLLIMSACSGPDEKKAKYYGRGKSFFDKGDYVKARLELKNAVQIDPAFDKALYLLGMVEMKQGNINGAFNHFAKAATANPQNLDAQVQLGKLYMMQGERDKAQDLASLVLGAQPEHLEGRFLQGALYLAAKEPQKTISLMTDMNRKGVQHPDLYLLLASARHDAGEDPAAERALLDGIRHNYGSLALHRVLADFYAERGNVPAAEQLIRQMIKLDPKEYSYTITLAGLYLKAGQQSKSRRLLAELTDANPGREDIVHEVATFLTAKGDAGEAERILRKGIAASGIRPRLRLALSELLVQTGRPEECITILKECLTAGKELKNQDQIEVKNALARIYLGKGEVEETTKLVEEVLKGNPHNHDANLTKGSLLLDKNDGAGAVMVFRTLVTDNPKQLQGYLLLAQAHLLNGEMNLALETLQQAQRLEPDSSAVMHALARYYLYKQDLVSAEGQLRAALAKKPDDLQLTLELGDLKRAVGNKTEAARCYTQVKGSSQGAITARIRLSELYAAEGRFQAAADELIQAADLSPSPDQIIGRLVALYCKQGKRDKAIKYCRSQIANKPRLLSPYLLIGKLYGEQGNWQQAEEILKKAINVDREAQQTYLQLAGLYQKRNEKQKARSTYETVLARHPDSIEAANDFACFLADSGNPADLQQAVTLARQVHKRHPQIPQFMDTLGWVYYRQGNYREAAELLEKAAGKLPEHPLVRYHAGAVQYRVGKKVQARLHLQTAVGSKLPFNGKDEALALLTAL